MLKSNQSSKRNIGSASKLLGRCYLLNIFLSDQASSWSVDEKAKVKENMSLAISFIMNNSKKYNIGLKISQGNAGYNKDIYYPGVIPVDMFENHMWTEYMFGLIGFSRGNVLVEHIKRKYKVKQVAIIYHVNKQGTSYSLPFSSGTSPIYFAERNVMFYKYDDGRPTCAASYAHEILHSFGAAELYFPFDCSDDRLQLARQYFPHDVMLRVDYNINTLSIGEYTAYRIGWLECINSKFKVFEDDE